MMYHKKLIVIFVVLFAILAIIGSGWGQEIEKININKASAQELAKLQQVGPRCAVRIVEHRQKYGPFKLTEELMEVPGIGLHTYDRIKDQIIAQ
jgi:competence ComEA-like helix-hairpin-helix protein